MQKKRFENDPMCAHYKTPLEALFFERWAVEPPAEWTKAGLGIAVPVRSYVGCRLPMLEVSGASNLRSHSTKAESLANRTYNARSKSAPGKPSLCDEWSIGKHCIISGAAIYKPDWRAGKAALTQIQRADGDDLGIAGLCE
ncbi:hypothetical protein [Xylophilus sp. Leaf220]|uniref:hypothetical protein n=1 Tax=Xylophilus sp. Leaf220 TaxID=1735686 RepID=UPI0012E113A2|nr:hypothetical protein [Xylophilus sp. Leaf220]